ncbi:unnamed protein product [Ixodes pacificus]
MRVLRTLDQGVCAFSRLHFLKILLCVATRNTCVYDDETGVDRTWYCTCNFLFSSFYVPQCLPHFHFYSSLLLVLPHCETSVSQDSQGLPTHTQANYHCWKI